MSTSAIKVLVVTYNPPVPTWGGAMAFYRHFVERDDFKIKVLCSESRISFEAVPYTPLVFGPSQLTRRLFRTRLMPWLYGPHSLTASGRVPRAVWQTAESFQPDIVFTIAGTWDWSALVAQKIAGRLGVPLVASFNDWYNYGWFPSHPIFHGMIEKRFRRFYREADLALCTSEGMREALGSHPNAHILYPIGAPLPEPEPMFVPYKDSGRKFVVGFAGSLGDWYGLMLERLVLESGIRKENISFVFYGGNPSWSNEFDRYARESGIYRGQVPFQELREAMCQVDAMLLPMGFATEVKIVESTSFKTKFLDYLTYRRPILVWGPEYCSAVRVAREFGSAVVCSDPSASAALDKILALKNDAVLQTSLVEGADGMYRARFEPRKIHSSFVAAVERTIASFHSKSAQGKGKK